MEKFVVTREAIDFQVLFDYDTTNLKTSIKLHIISLKIKWNYLFWLHKGTNYHVGHALKTVNGRQLFSDST